MENSICTHCGGSLPHDEMIIFDGNRLCQECANDLTRTCDCCGERIWAEDEQGDSHVTLCANCYENRYSACEGCGMLVPNSSIYYLEDGDDYGYCYNCYQQRKDCVAIHGYNYKPAPIFYGEGNRFMGVELEIDDGGKRQDNAKQLLSLANAKQEHIYIKSDGSLDDGLEIVTHPMTLSYHLQEMPWQALVDKALSMGYYSHKAETCGLHVHVNRTTFGKTRDLQEDCISRVLFVVERFWEEMLRFSRRTTRQLEKWAARYGYKHCPKEILNQAKSCDMGRYTCINLTNYDTIEFRIFRGTLRYSTLAATLQMVDAICSLACSSSDVDLQQLSWPEFVEGLDKQAMPELIMYLKERRLYINEPIEAEREED